MSYFKQGKFNSSKPHKISFAYFIEQKFTAQIVRIAGMEGKK
jgi:hypothetical protein